MLNSGEFRASIRRAGPLAAAVALSLAPFATPAYASPINLGSGVATYTGQIATYLVGTSGLYDITAVGANGGQSSNGNLGGIGAQVSGEFNLTAGEQLLVLVGGAGTAGTATGTDDAGGGGGGGSFVVLSSGNGLLPLLVAGGGGGGGSGAAGLNASLGSSGVNGNPGSSGATGGGGSAGGSAALPYGYTGGGAGGGGGGFSGSGQNSAGVQSANGGCGFIAFNAGEPSGYCGAPGGDSSIGGGIGGTGGAGGGGGGGGGGSSGAGTVGLGGGGGGGGYSGGGAGNGGVTADTGGGGGGGGSYLASTALQTSEHADANTNSDLLGNGLVQFRAVQASVPEPGPLGLLGAGLLALFVSGRRRTRNAQG